MYLVLEYSLAGVNRIDTRPDIGEPWFSGVPIKGELDLPLKFFIDPNSTGNKMRALYKGAYPLYCDELIRALKDAGVDNLQLFDAEIFNPIDGKTYTNYKAVNIIGLVACVDMSESKRLTDGESTLLDSMDLDGFKIDENKAGGVRFFRLAESVTAVVAIESVADSVESKNIPGIRFLDPENWSG